MTEQEALIYLKNADHVLPQAQRGIAQGFASLADQISKQAASPKRTQAMQRLLAALQGVQAMFAPVPQPVPVRPLAATAPAPQRPAQPARPGRGHQPPPAPQSRRR